MNLTENNIDERIKKLREQKKRMKQKKMNRDYVEIISITQEIRRSKHFQQTEISEVLGKPKNYLSRIENLYIHSGIRLEKFLELLKIYEPQLLKDLLLLFRKYKPKR